MTEINITQFKQHSRLGKAVAELESITFEELQELIALSQQIVESTQTAPARVLADMPVVIPGGIKLYMPSIAALQFLDETLDRYNFNPADAEVFKALVYSLSRKPRELSRFGSRSVAEKAIKRFKKRLGLTIAELKVFNMHCLADFPVVSSKSCTSDAAALLNSCANLAKQTGGTIESWLWDRSAQKVVWLIRERTDAQAIGVKPSKIHAINNFIVRLKEIKEEQNG